MSDDPQRARDALAEQATRLRDQRLAEANAEQVARAEAEQYARDGGPARLRWSLARGPLRYLIGVVSLGLGALLFAGTVLAVEASGKAEAPTPVGVMVAAIASLVFVAVGAAVMVAMHRSALRRSRTWRAGLPFRIAGFEEALSLDKAVTGAALTVRFRQAAIPCVDLVELLRPKAETKQVTPIAGGVEIHSEWIGCESANWPVADWFGNIVGVLQEVHRGYPIEAVALHVMSTSEFHVPSGD